MSKKKTVNHIKSTKSKIKQPIVSTAMYPEFKPGKTPFLHYGREVLNSDVDWARVVASILNNGLTVIQLAIEMEVSVSMIEKIIAKNYEELTFKMGAHLLGIQFRMLPRISLQA